MSLTFMLHRRLCALALVLAAFESNAMGLSTYHDAIAWQGLWKLLTPTEREVMLLLARSTVAVEYAEGLLSLGRAGAWLDRLGFEPSNAVQLIQLRRVSTTRACRGAMRTTFGQRPMFVLYL